MEGGGGGGQLGGGGGGQLGGGYIPSANYGSPEGTLIKSNFHSSLKVNKSAFNLLLVRSCYFQTMCLLEMKLE